MTAEELLEEIRRGEETALEGIVKSLKQGKCNLFLGAGVHAPPPPPPKSPYVYEESKRPPIGSTFSKSLAAESKFTSRFPSEDVGNLQRVSQDFQVEKKRGQLIEKIKVAVYEGKEPSPALCALAKLDFPIIVTTNYDKLLEKALGHAGKLPYPPSVYKKNEKGVPEPTDDLNYDQEATPQRPFIFKIHGDIDKPDSVVITDEDYIHFILRMRDAGVYNPVPDTIFEKLKKWPTLFIGYSLRDYNLRVLFKTLRWGKGDTGFPDCYSVDLYPDRLIYKIWSEDLKYVSFLAQDVWTFVPELYRRVKGEEMPMTCQ
jgi:hypothetical protein